MRLAANIVGALLGLGFIAFGCMGLIEVKPKEQPVMTPEATGFMGALMTTGYIKMIAAIEVLGGLLTLIPRTRNIGLLFLGPILVNILAFHIFLDHGERLAPGLVFSAMAVFLLIAERRAWAALVHRAPAAAA